jgi:hypothetical protein
MSRFFKPVKPISQEQENNPFWIYNLKRNPFPTAGVINPGKESPIENGSIFNSNVRKSLIDGFEKKFLKPSVEGNFLPIGYLWAPSGDENKGMGKTAVMRYYQTLINSDYGNNYFNGEYKAAVIYIYPRVGEMKTLSSLSYLGLQRISEPMDGRNSLLNDMHLYLRYMLLEDAGQVLDPEKLLDSEYLFEKGIDEELVKEKIFNYLIESGISDNFAEVFASQSYNKFIVQFSKGQKQKMANEIFFNDMVILFTLTDYSHVYIFVDDLYEMFVKASKNDYIKFAEDLNYWVFRSQDSEAATKSFYTFVFTIHPTTEETLSAAWRQSGLAQFCPMNLHGEHAVIVDRLNSVEAVSLVETYLNFPEFRQGKPTNRYYPFTKEAIEEIAKANDYHPRKMLNQEYGCHRILNEAIERNVDVITLEFVQQILSEVSIAVGVQDDIDLTDF